MSKEKVVLLIFGEGGHKQEMKLLYEQLSMSSLTFITIGPSPLSQSLKHYSLGDVRHKKNRIKSFFMALIGVLQSSLLIAKLCLIHKVTGCISTGPGISIIPSILLRLLGKKVIFIETFCRFYTRSMTGRIMNIISSEFWVQNQEQTQLYKNAKFCGRL